LAKDKSIADTLNEPLSIGYGQTISQPQTVAFMLEMLNPRQGDKILDVGSGSGWTVAILSYIVGSEGKVFGIERIKELADFARNNINKHNFIDKNIAEIYHGNGYEGLPSKAPFDKIIVAAAAKEIPKELIKQLKVGGRMVIPLGEVYESQDILILTKDAGGKIAKHNYPGFIFVPLINSK